MHKVTIYGDKGTIDFLWEVLNKDNSAETVYDVIATAITIFYTRGEDAGSDIRFLIQCRIAFSYSYI